MVLGIVTAQLNELESRRRREQIISIVYGVLLIAFWMCVMGIMIAPNPNLPGYIVALGQVAVTHMMRDEGIP
jgi:hypothetical protein